jgi:hypothetical protein
MKEAMLRIATILFIALIAATVVMYAASHRVNRVEKPTVANPPHPMPQSIVLDFSASRSASMVPVKEADWDADWVSIKNVHADIRLPQDHQIVDHFNSIQFHRVNGDIVLVQLSFDKMSIVDAHALASRIAADWNLPTKEIDEWRKAASAGTWDPTSAIMVLNNRSLPTLDLEIRDSFEIQGTKPSRVLFCLTWPWQ